MKVRDLECWPPTWRGASGVSGNGADREGGILTAVRWDHKNQSITLTREYDGDRHSGLLEDQVRPLTTLYLLLGWHVGRALANIGSLEMTPERRR
ncbi:MAG TPA: hypothetical protein VGW35_12380 [Methylomirabilota bacterium]|jgi:hypothetical protein|nr:hypothetical protein [Methylomirabilota bacterium]